MSLTPEALANELLVISARRTEIFAPGRDGSFEEKDRLWLDYLKECLDPDTGLKIAGVSLGCDDSGLPDLEPALFAALKVIDSRNEELPEESKKRLDEDLIRAIAWNKKDHDFRYIFARHDCVRAPLTSIGCFRIFIRANGPAPQGAAARTFNRVSSYVKNLIGLNGQSARDKTKNIGALHLIRGYKGRPDGIGTLGGLTDRHQRNEPLEKSIEEKIFGHYTGLLGRVVFEDHIDGHTTAEVAELIKSRIGRELFETVGSVIEISLAQLLMAGKADDIIADINGRYYKVPLTTEEGRATVGMRTSARETIEELTEALQILRIGLDGLDQNGPLRAVRHQLSERLGEFIARLEDIRAKEIQKVVDAGNGKGRIWGPEPDPLGEEIEQVPLQNVYDDGFFLSMWKPKTLDDAIRPPAGIPRIALIKPMGFRTRLSDEIFSLMADVGSKCKDIVREINESKDPELAPLKQRLAKKEIRGLERASLNDTLKRWGRKGGAHVHPGTGDDLTYCFRYAHEYWSFWDEARSHFEKNPEPGMTTTELMVELVGQLQQEICEDALGDASAAYTIDIITAARLMNGGKLASLADTYPHAERLGLDQNAFVLMHKEAERVMERYGFPSTSALRNAVGPSPQIGAPNPPRLSP